jgi:hypothetical protein
MAKAACLALWALSQMACSTPPGPPLPSARLQTPPKPQNIAIVFESRGSFEGFEKPSELVIATDSAWRSLWDLFTQFRTPRPPLPQIDFQKDVLIAAGLGQRSSACCTIAIDTVLQFADSLQALVRESYPEGLCASGAVLTRPTVIVRTAKSRGPVRFVHRRIPTPC